MEKIVTPKLNFTSYVKKSKLKTMQININALKNLFERISQQIENRNASLKQTGLNFNIFEIIGTQKAELVHSAFIAELLNPNGTHAQRICFLKRFLSMIDIENLKLEKTIVKTEYSKNIDGRLDILISDGITNICIENKIWAKDQDRQIKRYFNSLNGGG